MSTEELHKKEKESGIEQALSGLQTPSSSVDSLMNKVLWTVQTEELLKQWGDISACYKWLHDQSYRKYKRINYFYSIPIIVLSTVAGTLNVSLAGYVPSAYLNYAQAGIGAINIFTGVLTTLQSFFSYAQLSESHNNASMGWSKMHRNIIIELNLEQQFRTDADRFLRDCRRDYDRLLEQSPPIPTEIIILFKKKFKTQTDLVQPDICDNITHTEVYRQIPNSPSFTPIEKPIEEKVNVITLDQLKDILVDDAHHPSKRIPEYKRHSYSVPPSSTGRPYATSMFVPKVTENEFQTRIRTSSVPDDLPKNKGSVKDLIKKFTSVDQVITKKLEPILQSSLPLLDSEKKDKVILELPNLNDPTLVVEESLLIPSSNTGTNSDKNEEYFYKYTPGMLMTSSVLNEKSA